MHTNNPELTLREIANQLDRARRLGLVAEPAAY